MYLLDTHTYLWFVNGDTNLPSGVNAMLETAKGLFVSIATFWELAIKNSLGKLELPFSITRMMEDCNKLQISILPIKANHLETLKTLPWIHRDPFDRLLISQALAEDLTLITVDKNIKQYNVKTYW